MLKRTATIAAPILVLASLASCGENSGDVAGQTSPVFAGLSASEVCEIFSKVPAIAGDNPISVYRAASTTVGGLNSWLGERYREGGGPSESVATLPGLDQKLASNSSAEVCVFKSSVPRPIPGPPGAFPSDGVTGIRVLVQDLTHYAIDSFGDVDMLAKELDAFGKN